MGVTGYSFEIVSSVPADKLFKATVYDMHELAPKVMPEVVKSAAIHGDGGVGTFKEFHFTEVIPYNYVKERIESLDKHNFVCSYSLVEGGQLGTKVKGCNYTVKIEPSATGSVLKVSVEIETVDGVEFTAEELKKEKEGTVGTYKAIEAYLQANA
ncbi:hypothetical protein IFM89_036087 [Coptis chinensis]|uniref:Bet v I/Major latex protein domain-containing protein n=3 Tax=cellular organisms TaxID=131567 RepID=A0A835HV23_9MAGN|nr:hypothetical protein IFM89_036087 [Coptis chinensis]